MGDPSKEEIDEFITANGVDDRAAADLRECAPNVQRAVLARGDLSTARNPSAALLVRIRDARVGGSSGGMSGTSVGLPSSADIESYIKKNDIDKATAETLRSSSPTVKRAVLAGGDLTGMHNPSAALAARIKEARAGGTTVMLSAGVALPSSADVEDFIKINDVDQSSADQLRSSPPTVQRVVISRGDLRSARNPSSALLARIRDAKVGMPDGLMPAGLGMPLSGVAPTGYACGYPPPSGFAHAGFPPPGGYPPPPGDGNPGGGYGYPPAGYGMYPGMYTGIGYPAGYTSGVYPGSYPGGGYPSALYGGYAPGGYHYSGGSTGCASTERHGTTNRSRGRRSRSRSSSGSYSGSYSYSRSRSRRGHRGRRSRAGRK